MASQRVLALLLLLLSWGRCAPVTVLTSFVNTTLLVGPFVSSGFARFLGWPMLPGVLPDVCTTQGVGGVAGSIILSYRLNRCLSAWSVAGTVPTNTFINTPKNFSARALLRFLADPSEKSCLAEQRHARRGHNVRRHQLRARLHQLAAARGRCAP